MSTKKSTRGKRTDQFLRSAASKPWRVVIFSGAVGAGVVFLLWLIEPDEINWWATAGTWATVAALVLAVVIWLATSSDTADLMDKMGALGELVGGLDAQKQSDAEFSRREVEAAIGAIQDDSGGRVDPQILLRTLISMTSGRRRVVSDASNLPLADDQVLKAPIEVAPGAVPEDIISSFNGDVVRSDIESATFFPGPGNSKHWMIRTKDKRRFAVSLHRSGGKVINDLSR